MIGSTIRTLAAALAALALAIPAYSDSGSGAATTATHFTPENAASYSKQIERSLAANNARLAIVFRAGRSRDKLPEGIAYTHGSFWVYQTLQLTDGSQMQGYVSHNLYHGDGETLPRTQSYLTTDFPYEFINAAAEEDVAIIIPTPEMQRRIMTMMTNGDYEAMHDPDYSLIASPYNDLYQNCTEFLLDVTAAAAWETTDYAQIKANLTAHFNASRVKTGPLQRMFGPIADERLKTRDHRGKPIQTATYASLSTFMFDNDLATQTYVLSPDAPAKVQVASVD